MFDEEKSSKRDHGHDDIDLEELLNILEKSNGDVDKDNEGENEDTNTLGPSLSHEDEDNSHYHQEPGSPQQPHEDPDLHSSSVKLQYPGGNTFIGTGPILTQSTHRRSSWKHQSSHSFDNLLTPLDFSKQTRNQARNFYVFSTSLS